MSRRKPHRDHGRLEYNPVTGEWEIRFANPDPHARSSPRTIEHKPPAPDAIGRKPPLEKP